MLRSSVTTVLILRRLEENSSAMFEFDLFITSNVYLNLLCRFQCGGLLFPNSGCGHTWIHLLAPAC